MEHPALFEERRKYPRYSISLPLEYWQTDDTCHGGIVGNLSEAGLLIYSLQEMPVGEELNVRIFFLNGYEFDGIGVAGKIIWGGRHHETDWKGYKYGTEIVGISREDRKKLANLLRSPSTLEEISEMRDTVPRNPTPEKQVSPSVLRLASCRMKENSRNCLWERLKTKILHLW